MMLLYRSTKLGASPSATFSLRMSQAPFRLHTRYLGSIHRASAAEKERPMFGIGLPDATADDDAALHLAGARYKTKCVAAH